jgi:AraC-like DNA-binding protein
VALFIILPPAGELGNREVLFRLMASCRPHSILPHVKELDPEELAAVLRRFPSQLALEATEYLVWRGIETDLDTRRLIRRTLDLSSELTTVKGLARALYMSRRALGRRFMTRGLPVPSHWLHFGRILRGSIRLQQPSSNLFSIGCDLGYPDGFAFSNQMKRLTGLRPSVMREAFGWEWVVESWLHREATNGGLTRSWVQKLFPRLEADTSRGTATGVGGQLGAPLRVAEDAGKSR